jgi:2'-5' RNA ligase
MLSHQDKQKKIISQIEKQVKNNALQATAVVPVHDFASDNRICLTSVHFPSAQFINIISKTIIEPLKAVFPNAYYYEPSSLHLTIKNIRVINNPPNFTSTDIETAKKTLNKVIPNCVKFNIYPYRLLLFKNNLALMSTTDEELDRIITNLNTELEKSGISDDKQYVNDKYYFSNMTVARFNSTPSTLFKKKVAEISSALNLSSYCVDSVSLITGNAVMKKLTIHKTINLKD